jgi:hypothetical protein
MVGIEHRPSVLEQRHLDFAQGLFGSVEHRRGPREKVANAVAVDQLSFMIKPLVLLPDTGDDRRESDQRRERHRDNRHRKHLATLSALRPVNACERRPLLDRALMPPLAVAATTWIQLGVPTIVSIERVRVGGDRAKRVCTSFRTD